MADPQGPVEQASHEERFHATNGHVMGWFALVGALVVVVVGLVYLGEGFPLALVLGAVVFGILAWAILLRPRVWATEHDLVMRSILHTAWIPLAAIDQVAVRQVLTVTAGDRRYVSPSIGRTRRQMVKARHGHGGGHSGGGLFGGDLGLGGVGADAAGTKETAADSYPVFVEQRIGRLADDARTRQGVRRHSAEQAELAAGVRRSLAWPEIVALAVAVAALVSAIVL